MASLESEPRVERSPARGVTHVAYWDALELTDDPALDAFVIDKTCHQPTGLAGLLKDIPAAL